jgi:hypothetical protein
MGIKVISATYGTNTKGYEVTEMCQGRIDNGNNNIVVDNDAMGGDPDPGATKLFGIYYSFDDGTKVVRAGAEGDFIDLTP